MKYGGGIKKRSLALGWSRKALHRKTNYKLGLIGGVNLQLHTHRHETA